MKEDDMPRISKQTATETVAMDGLEVHLENFEGGYTVSLRVAQRRCRPGSIFRGLPDDRCQFPRWGCAVQGRMGFRFADRVETYEAGERLLRSARSHADPLRRHRDRRVSARPISWTRRSGVATGNLSAHGLPG